MERSHLKRVAVILEGRVEYERNVLRGIRDFSSSQSNWLMRLEMPGKGTLDFLENWKPDGVLFQSAGLSSSVMSRLKTMRNAIHLSETPPRLSLRSVGLDNGQIGITAAEYFHDRGFETFAFVGAEGSGFSVTREKAFCDRVGSLGYRSEVFRIGPGLAEAEVEKWLKSLPKPCALFSTHDECSLYLTTVCRSAGISIPEEISILGVDNDQLICELAWPQLSSIAVPSRRVGQEAAKWLSQMIDGAKPDRNSLLLPPTGVVTRHSTEVNQTEDEVVNRALRYMQSHVGQRIGVDDVLREVGVSRRLLERKFSHHLSRSPLAEIQRLKVNEIKRLLLDTRKPLHEIAGLCGVSDASRLVSLFRKFTGTTPGDYRKNKRDEKGG